MFSFKTHALLILILVVASERLFAQDKASVRQSLIMNALVIGNQEYGSNVNSLNNPVNDANLMANTLSKIGFNVVTKVNLTHEGMDEAIADFSRRLEPGSISFVYYAGHGIQDSSGRNYLIPVDAKLPSEASMKYQTVPLNFVVETLEKSASSLRIVVLDCCRDNPFSRGWGRSASTSGLARVIAPDGTIIAYSTKEGMTASDGIGSNSLYTEKLAQSLESSAKLDRSVVDAFRDASQMVGKLTSQKPYLTFDATMQDFFFTGISKKGNIAEKSSDGSIPDEITKPKDLNFSFDKKPAKRSPEIAARFEKVSQFKQKNELRSAINEYTRIIADPASNKEDLRAARLGRGALLLSLKSNNEDIIEAVKDYVAAGEPGATTSVESNKGDLVQNKNSDGSSPLNEIKGQIFRGDVVQLTTSNGNWVWVSAVHGDRSKSGWVNASVFTRPSVETPKLETPERKLVAPQIVGPNSSFPQQYNPPRATAPPPRPRNAWETPEWEPAGRASEMKRAQQEWDRQYGRR